MYSYWKGVNLRMKNKTMVYKELRKVVEDIIEVSKEQVLTMPDYACC